ncbi:MAG: Ig-like domain-containing protein [Bacteroidales bacterium]
MKQKILHFAILALLASALATTATADPPPPTELSHLLYVELIENGKLHHNIVIGKRDAGPYTTYIDDEVIVSRPVRTNGWTITVLKGGKLTIKDSGSLTIESSNGGTSVNDGSTGGGLINGGEVIVESGGEVEGGKLILAGTSVVTNDSLFTVYGSVTANAGATLTNNKVINLMAGALFTNNSVNVTSPGMIVAANNDAIDLQPPLKSGFIKRQNDAQTWDIEVYGNSAGSSVWSEWHTKYLDGTEEPDASAGSSAATLRILSGATLDIPQGITLDVGGSDPDPQELLLDVQGALAVRNGGAVIVNSSKVFDSSEPANANAHAFLRTEATLTIESGGTFTVSAGNNLLAQTGTVINNSGTLTLNGSSSADNRLSYINGGLSVKGAGKVEVKGASLQVAGALSVENAGGLVQVTGGTLTASTQATIVTNNGKIQVTGGMFNNKTSAFTGTGLVEVSGSGVLGTDANWLFPDKHVVVNTTDNSKTITVYGINTWTSALQAYIPSVDTLKLATAAARLLIDNAPLTVSAGKTLTISGAGFISVSAPEKIENGGLITLNTVPLANITGWTPDGFVQTPAADDKKVITAYGNNTWSLFLQGAFSDNSIGTLFIPEGAELDFSNSTGLTIETGKVLRNDGTLKGGTKPLNVAGTLLKGKNSSTEVTEGNLFHTAGIINTELNPDWVSLPATAAEAEKGNPFILSFDKGNGERDTLLPTTHYTVNPASAPGTATIIGVEAQTAGGSGYYGSFTRGYQAVTEVTLSKTALPLLVRETFTLTDTVKPEVETEAGKDSVNQHVIWSVANPAGSTVATVTQDGKVTAVAAGQATITVTSVEKSDAFAECEVTVTLPVDSVRISAPRLKDGEITIIGRDTAHLSVTVYPDDANKTIEWTTGDETRAKVIGGTGADNPLRVQIIGDTIRKDTVIYVKVTSAEGPKDSVKVKVIPVPVDSVKITTQAGAVYDSKKDSLQKGDSLLLSATIYPDSAYNKAVTWESLSPSVVSVEAAADGKGKVTALTKDTARIVVTAADGAKTDTVTIKVYEVPVERIDIADKEKLEADSLQVGKKWTLTVETTPEKANATGYSWRSLNGAIATVDGNGTVTAVSPGDARIAVFYSGNTALRDTVTIRVYTVEVTGVEITYAADEAPLNIRETLQLDAAVEPANATDKRLTWSSGDDAVATVDASGKVTGVSAGETYIYATTTEGGHKDSIKVTVYKVDVEDVAIAGRPSGDALQIGYTRQLRATLTPANASDTAVVWESGDTTIAKVDASGLVTALSAGQTTIAVTTRDGNITDSFTLTVYAVAVSSVTIAGKAAIKADSLGLGATLQLTATVLPANATNKAITWSSGAEAVATVSEEGKVTALTKGATYIYVTTADGGKKDSVAIKVYTIPVRSVSLTAGADSLALGATLQLAATILPEGVNEAYETDYTSNAPGVATVAQDGKVTGVSVGEAQISVTVRSGGAEYKDALTLKVYTIPVSVTIAAGPHTLATGTTLQLSATVSPANATDKRLTWSSGDAGIATVNAAGLVTGISAGETYIYVTAVASGLKDSVTVTVYRIHVESVTIDGATEIIDLYTGDRLGLTATVTPANATDKAITWTSGDAGIAAVDAAGEVTAISAGETFIYVTTVDGEYRDSVAIEVHAVPVESVTIESEASLSLPVGTTHELTATVAPANATDKAVIWTSGDAGIAAVDTAGAVTAIAAGETFIYVTTVDGEYRDSVVIEVYAVPVEGVTIESEASLSLPIGATQELTATVTPENATDKAVIWRSGNEEVATVANGTVTAVAEGEATIYVTTVDGGLTDSVALTVYTVPVPVEGVTIAGAPDSLAVDSTLQLTAVILPAGANVDYETAWESGDSAVATVDAAGLVTGVSEGEATIYVTVTTADGEYKDSVVLTVYTIPVEGVTIESEASLSLPIGATQELTATITPENATDKAVIWRSGNEEVATVANGTVTAVAEGEATIYVTTVDGGLTDSVALTVYTVPVPVEGVTIAGAPDSLAVDSTLQLTAVILPAGANVDYETAWESGDSAVATVDAAGLVTGVSEGEATIYVTVTTADGEYKDSVTIAVYTAKVLPKITAVAIESKSATLIIVTRPAGDAKGNDYGTLQLGAVITYTPADATIEEVVASLAWSSSDSTIATVNDAGLVTAVSAGTATITLTVTPIEGEAISVAVDITVTTTGVAAVPGAAKAYIADNILYVNSAVTEKVDIYTISGKLAYSAVKSAGETQIPLTGISDGVLIIRGASGWIQKAVK